MIVLNESMFTLVTPELAEQWLAKNHTDNRKISVGSVASLMSDMSTGCWRPTHQGICFDGDPADYDSVLLDGQHRLDAIRKSGIAQRLLVFVNPLATFKDPIDGGRKRTVGDQLVMPNRFVAALNILRMLEMGKQSTAPLTVGMAERLEANYKSLLTQLPAGLVAGVAAACAWGMPIDERRVLEFASKVITGEMLQAGDPAYQFRNWKSRTTRIDGWSTCLACLNALRYHLQGRRISSIFVGEIGYRAFVSRRRALGIPNTPTTEIVDGTSWTVTHQEGAK